MQKGDCLFASVLSAAIMGVEVRPVKVEADVSNGLPSFVMVGFPSTQVKGVSFHSLPHRLIRVVPGSNPALH